MTSLRCVYLAVAGWRFTCMPLGALAFCFTKPPASLVKHRHKSITASRHFGSVHLRRLSSAAAPHPFPMLLACRSLYTRPTRLEYLSNQTPEWIKLFSWLWSPLILPLSTLCGMLPPTIPTVDAAASCKMVREFATSGFGTIPPPAPSNSPPDWLWVGQTCAVWMVCNFQIHSLWTYCHTAQLCRFHARPRWHQNWKSGRMCIGSATSLREGDVSSAPLGVGVQGTGILSCAVGLLTLSPLGIAVDACKSNSFQFLLDYGNGKLYISCQNSELVWARESLGSLELCEIYAHNTIVFLGNPQPVGVTRYAFALHPHPLLWSIVLGSYSIEASINTASPPSAPTLLCHPHRPRFRQARIITNSICIKIFLVWLSKFRRPQNEAIALN